MERMKKRLFMMIGLTLASIVLPFASVSAQQTPGMSDEMTDTHIQRIQANCGDALRTIQQLHTNDAPLRVDRGQVFDSISTKLMARLNGRLVLNKLDGSSLVKITAQYDKTLGDFRKNYKQYDDQMSIVLTINCTKQPVTFYDNVGKARDLRTKLHANVVSLNHLVGDYEKAFDVFRSQFKSDPTNRGSS
jgi:hypothetical protein